jgi:hypothetical protein
MKGPKTRNPTTHRILAIVMAIVFMAAIGPTATAQVIEDFEGYSDTPALLAVWPFATSLDTATANPSTGTQSMYKQSFDLSLGHGSYVHRLFDPGLDLSGQSIHGWARRDPGSVDTVGFRIWAEDGSGVMCLSPIVLVSDSSWHRLDLGMVEDCSLVDTTNITRIAYQMTNYTDVTGHVYSNFDDLEIGSFFDGFESGDTSSWSATLP